MKGSSLSVNYGGSRSGGGGSGGGGYPPNENFTLMHQDTNRQILLILLRLQQDTNNVITRLSYLEATVLSLQVKNCFFFILNCIFQLNVDLCKSNLQMNRIENSIQYNNQKTSAFSPVNNTRVTAESNLINNIYNFLRTIDWKTVAIGILWPFIIRLVFFVFRRLKEIM